MLTVYSKDNCPGCVKLLKELESKEGEDYQVKKLGKDISVEDFLKKYPDAKTVPHVVYE